VRIVQSLRFEKAVKRLHANQRRDLDQAVRDIAGEPAIGQAKLGDLAGVRVYKFRMVNQLVLLAYAYDAEADRLNLVELGSHENFYRDLKIR
jgi:mRNA-degrading endonuclease YafQ of YafQ-DinJ toxin-antitoxin module